MCPPRYTPFAPRKMSLIPPVVSVTELADLLGRDSEIRLLDVRTPGEFESAHIFGAYNVPIDSLSEHAREIATVNDPIVLVCQSGQRARKAEDALRGAGMPNLHVLDGGVSAWVAAGQPVTRGTPRMSLERQVRIVAGSLAAVGGLLAVSVDPMFAWIPAVIGSGLAVAGITNTCAMAMLLARLPYNRSASCDVSTMVRQLRVGTSPAGV